MDAVEIAAFRRQIWDSVNGLLAASKAASSAKDPGAPFWALGGGEPTEADMTLFGFVCPSWSPLRTCGEDKVPTNALLMSVQLSRLPERRSWISRHCRVRQPDSRPVLP